MSTQKSNMLVKFLPSSWHPKTRSIIKKAWLVAAFLIILAAVISTLFRSLTPWVEQHKTEVEQQLSFLLGEKVQVSTVETGWYWFEPVIKLNQVRVAGDNQDTITLSKLLVGINLFSSLWHWQIQPGVLFIDDLKVTLRQTANGWRIEGINNLGQSKVNWDLAHVKPLLAWILGQQKIILKNLVAEVYLQDGTYLPLHQLNLKIANRSGYYKIKGSGALNQPVATQFQLLAELALNPNSLQKTKGEIFFSINQAVLDQWQTFLQTERFQVKSGQGDVQLWLDFAKGKPSNIQAQIRFQRFSWIDKQQNKQQNIPSLSANLAWQPISEGWQLSADQVQLQLQDKQWPENSMLIRYQQKEDAYLIYVKHLLIDSFLALDLPWPDSWKPYLTLQPQGDLEDTQLQFRQANLSSVLTRFSGLSWQQSESWPGVSHISGALFWQPEGGRLKLVDNDLLIKPNKKPSVLLSALDSTLSWQKANDNWIVSLEHLVLNHPNLLLNANGKWDAGQLQLAGQFTAKNAQELTTYLPANQLKPKLEQWLKKGVKRIEKINGNFLVNGPWADFPFDQKPGEFLINTQLSGVDLHFAHHWPLTKDIEAQLQVNKRHLEANLSHANLKGIVVDRGNLQVTDLGSDRETLLFHSQMDAKADKVLSYVLASPLQNKLGALNRLKMHGLLGLDLQLEVPLYPENDHILARGNLTFDKNSIEVSQGRISLPLTGVKGSLLFNEAGVINSHFNAHLFGTPATMQIQSIHDAMPYTQVSLDWQTNPETLSQQWQLPLNSVMQGSLEVNSVIKLTNDPDDLDNLHLETTLEGLAMDLPSPLGKSKEIKAPLVLDFGFNPKTGARLKMNYNNRLKSELIFSSEQSQFALHKGEIRLGEGEVQEPKQAGLYLVGNLATWEPQAWLNLQAKFPSTGNGKNSVLDALKGINLKFATLTLANEQFPQLSLKALKQSPNKWSIQLDQEKINGHLQYQTANNTLSGELNRLYLTQIQGKGGETGLKPKDFPNLDLRINSLQVNGFDLGELSISAKTSSHCWQIEELSLKTPSYLLTASGEWKAEGKSNSTHMQASMHISDLAATLERLHMTPAVEARQGELRFAGSISAALPDFSLKKINGDLAIQFKEGRITNLSPETESKLGLGKLLSILSLQTIPRRLKLDFSDLAKTGYSFDKFEGSFNIANGVMRTEDSTIEGPVAYASIKGDLDISNQLYDLDIKIVPHITASLPIVAAIAGGPIAGLATWAASNIINQGMQNISSYTYKVTGPWNNPSMKPGSMTKKSS